MLTTKPLSIKEVKEISNWKYDGDYAIYNENSYEDKIKNNDSLVNPNKQNNFTCFYLDDIFIGYINLVEKVDHIFFGIGLAPDYCGKGYGQQITKQAILLSKEKYPNKPLQLFVRSWNKRAINCYEKSGFHIVKEVDIQTTLGKGHFLVMEA